MSKRKNPDTSIEAYKSVKDGMIKSHHSLILKAMETLHLPIYEEIADRCSFANKNQASRRLSEMEALGLIHKTTTKKRTSSGRMAYTYALGGLTIDNKTTPPVGKKQKKKLEPNQKTITVRSYERRIKVKDLPDNQNKLF